MIALISALVLVAAGLLLSYCGNACTNDEYKAKAEKWCGETGFTLVSCKRVANSDPITYLCEVKGNDGKTRRLEIKQGFLLDSYDLVPE